MRTHRLFWMNPTILFLQILIIASLVATILTFDNLVTWISLVAGVLIFAISEYVVHRYLLHEFPRLLPIAYKGHVAHHIDPKDPKYLFSSIYYDPISYIILIVIAFIVTHSYSITCAIVAGMSAAQLYYQWMHYISHQPVTPRTPWGKKMKKWHLRHHYLDEEAWYGVSNPVLDILLHTDKQHNSQNKK